MWLPSTSAPSAAPPDPFAVAADLLAPAQDPYRHDPVGWVRDRLGEHLWSKQAEIAASVRDNRRTAVPSCHEAGKSFLASRLMGWWVETHPPGEAFVVSTAPTFPQVKAILWRELGKAHRRGKLSGRVNLTEWYLAAEGGEELVAFGRKPSDTDPTAFQGIHTRWVLVVIDEAGGVPRALWDAADSLIANEGGRLLAIGNPDDPTSHFAEVCTPGNMASREWTVIHIDGLETPNVTGEWVPAAVRPLLISARWVEEKRESWGEDSPLYLSKVRGQFPPTATDTVVPWPFVLRSKTPQEPGEPVHLGVDVGGGGDETVIRERRGAVPGRVWKGLTGESTQVTGMVMQAIRETGADKVKVDVIGLGWGVVGRLQEMRREGLHRAEIVPVNVGEASSDPRRFPRLRDELWWVVGRELSETGGWDLSEVADDVLAQLAAPKFTVDSAGRTKVEPKEETRARIGRSPDDADALLLAFYEPPVRKRGRALVA